MRTIATPAGEADVRRTLLPAVLLLSSCSSALDVPTSDQASEALTHELRLSWTATASPDRSPVRVDASGHLIALVASGAPPLKPRSAKPPTASVSSVENCATEGNAVVCDTTYTVDGSRQPAQRVRYWRSGNTWRAHFIR